MYSRASRVFLIIFLCSVWAVYADELVAEPAANVPTPAITDADMKYFIARDELCLKIVQEGDVGILEALKKQTMDIIGKVTVEGFSGDGNLELAIYLEYEGEDPCNTLDGLYFYSAHEGLRVTTSSFILNYAARHSKQSEGASLPDSMEDLYALSSAPDVNSDLYAQIPVRTAKGQDFAYASLYRTTSDDDIGPKLPDTISAIVWVGNRRFTLSAPAKTPDIPECDKIWKDFSARSERAKDTYQEATSNGKEIEDDALNERLRYASERILERGVAAFKACYGKAVLEKSVFAPFVEQAQALVDRVKAD